MVSFIRVDANKECHYSLQLYSKGKVVLFYDIDSYGKIEPNPIRDESEAGMRQSDVDYLIEYMEAVNRRQKK